VPPTPTPYPTYTPYPTFTPAPIPTATLKPVENQIPTYAPFTLFEADTVVGNLYLNHGDVVQCIKNWLMTPTSYDDATLIRYGVTEYVQISDGDAGMLLVSLDGVMSMYGGYSCR
jgi:hypothetical protein